MTERCGSKHNHTSATCQLPRGHEGDHQNETGSWSPLHSSPVGTVKDGTLHWVDAKGVEHSGPYIGCPASEPPEGMVNPDVEFIDCKAHTNTSPTVPSVRVTYDEEAGALYVYLVERIEPGTANSEVIHPGQVLIDRSPGGQPLGVEILFPPGTRMRVSTPLTGALRERARKEWEALGLLSYHGASWDKTGEVMYADLTEEDVAKIRDLILVLADEAGLT